MIVRLKETDIFSQKLNEEELAMIHGGADSRGFDSVDQCRHGTREPIAMNMDDIQFQPSGCTYSDLW